MIETGHDPWPQQGMLSLKCKDDCIKENQSYFFKKQASIWSFYRSFYFCEIFDHITKLLVIWIMTLTFDLYDRGESGARPKNPDQRSLEGTPPGEFSPLVLSSF